MNNPQLKIEQLNIKKTFRKLGTCSRTFFYILNHEFGHHNDSEEQAADPLAGGIMQEGYQCGMLWGSSLAAGAESYRRYGNSAKAVASAITATQYLLKSFVTRTKSTDCLDITNCDWSSRISIARYFITGKFLSCFKLAEKWAPEAVEAATMGLSRDQIDVPQPPLSCASEVARKMGASEEEQVIVAGFAGGLGLSGNACAALGAAIWLNSLSWCKEHKGKSVFSNPEASKTLDAFYEATDYEILCHKISGKRFDNLNDHAEFLKNGGCEKLIDALARGMS